MGQALYRKYRSRKFGEVVGQKHITRTLSKAVKSGRISHAYLFTGPRGVGKTSVARILAHSVNDLEYSGDSLHLDIIEIDAASNRRIDEIRDLREKVHIAPTSARYKVYIIDEVHMLTREAFNALLKTLEEPPAHCIFILATTEAHKLPPTIVSRTQRFVFKPISQQAAVDHLKKIAENEKIRVSEEALELIAEHGEGSFRDSIGLLDQLGSHEREITGQTVSGMLGLPPIGLLREIISAVVNGQAEDIAKNLEQLWSQGSNPVLIAHHLSRLLRNKLLKEDYQSWLPVLLRQLIELPTSAAPGDYLEICLMEACASNRKLRTVSQATTVYPVNAKKAVTAERPQQSVKNTRRIDNGVVDSAAFDISMWPKVVLKAKDKAASLYTALRLARPQLNDDVLTLVFEFPFHQKKVKLARNLHHISELIEQVSGAKIIVECSVDKKLFQESSQQAVSAEIIKLEVPASRSPVEAINNIFGPAEMLES